MGSITAKRVNFKKTVVIDVVGLSESVIGESTPFLADYVKRNHITRIRPMLPAVTTSVQSTYLTGKPPSKHGIVGNGWYDRSDSEIKFWKQSNHLVLAEKIWDKAKALDPNFTCSKMFWWYNMYANVDYSVTPRPQYHADGVKAPDCYSLPEGLRDELQEKFGVFPLFHFWGPKTSIKASQWIADASMYIDQKYDPTLTFIYLPHLDYCLQKFSIDSKQSQSDLTEIDSLLHDLVKYYESKDANVIILSEYGIVPVNHPIHINRILREAGYLSVRKERWYELLDAGASKAFAVSDHQIAHIYLNDKSIKDSLMSMLKGVKGIHLVLDRKAQKKYQIDHERSGDIVLVADANSWFTYYYWLDDKNSPDFAKTVEIHRKPGYDPCEMFFDQGNRWIKLKAAYKLLRKKLGFRYTMDVISLDANLVKGSHGAVDIPKQYFPILISNQKDNQLEIKANQVYSLIWKSLMKPF